MPDYRAGVEKIHLVLTDNLWMSILLSTDEILYWVALQVNYEILPVNSSSSLWYMHMANLTRLFFSAQEKNWQKFNQIVTVTWWIHQTFIRI